MTDWNSGFSRRRFLSGVAVLGAMPLYSRLAAFPGLDPNRQWTGDDFEEGHERLRNPYALLRDIKEREEHPELYDVIVVGGGIAGLTAAYKLRQRNILLLERERETGGVSKSENWNGIEYAIGAAYMIDPEPDPEYPDPRDVQNFELLEELGLRKKGEDLHVCERGRKRRWATGEENHCVFANTRVIPEDDVYSAQNNAFFEHVLEHDNFPAVPPEDPELVAKLDTVSFKQFLRDARLQQELYGKTVGPISLEGWEAIEYYFWGAFGTNTWETSAYHGLNFFAAEFSDILVYPGGNAYIAKRLTERIRRHNAHIINTGYYALQIDRDGQPDTWTILAYHKGKIHRYRTRAVVFSAPLFLAKGMIPNLPREQRKAIESLDYRSYVVANVLLRRRIDEVFEHERFRNGYELTRIHELDPRRYSPAQLSAHGVYSDVVVADFAVGRAPDYAVLTVYRPYPYAHGRDRLRYLTYSHVEREIREAVLEGLSGHGLRERDIEGIRLTRWGHPMIIAQPGQLADDTMKIARQSQDGLYFAHTDIQGAPAIENALASAFDAVKSVERYLS